MVFRLHLWSPSCTAATLRLCWNSEHSLDCYSPRHVLHLNCSIVILIRCGRNRVCSDWGYYREIGGREGTDVEQACRVGLKPVGKSWDVSYISCIFLFHPWSWLIGVSCGTVFSCLLLTLQETRNQCIRTMLCPQSDSTCETCDVHMKRSGIARVKAKGMSRWWGQWARGGGSGSQDVLSSFS